MNQTQQTVETEEVQNKDVASESEVNVLKNLEELIRSNFATIERLAAERKKTKEMVDSALFNNEAYRGHLQVLRDANKTKAEIRYKIMKDPINVQLKEKVKELGAEIKEAKTALSEYLVEYRRMTGATQLELFDGQVGQIFLSARFVKTGKK